MLDLIKSLGFSVKVNAVGNSVKIKKKLKHLPLIL